MRIWADWFEPSVVAHTTLLESYFAAHLLVQKNALRLYIRTKLHLSNKEPVTSFIKKI